MATSPETRRPETRRDVWTFATCEFDDLRYELRVDGSLIDLERKPLDLLRYLLSKPGEVVRKEELLEVVWPGVMVVDASLATAVSKLRKAFGDQEIIQTVPRVGYRLVVPVERVRRNENEDSARKEPNALNADAPAIRSKSRLWQTRTMRLIWGVLAISCAVATLTGLVASRSRKSTVTQPVSLAILPFQNLSSGESLDYLRSALPDEIAHTLAAARSLNVRPTASSSRFSGPGLDFHKVGEELDVNRVLTGHFLIVGDRLRVTMEAIDTDANRVVWHDSFDVASNNLLAMQEQVAAISRGQLANVLEVKGFVTDTPPQARSEEAYELYLKSLALNWDNKTDKQAIELLRRVVLLDPNYAPAWGMLSLRYYGAARFGGGGSEMLTLSDAAAEKELALNPDSLDPIAEMTIHRTERGDLAKAHQIALELVRRRPDDPNLHHVLSYVLRYGGSVDEAGRECEVAVLLAAKVVWGSCATTFMELGKYDRAKFFLRKDLSSEWSKALTIEVLLREGAVDQAIRIPAPQIPHWESSYKMLLACARHEPTQEIKALASKMDVDDDPEVDYLFAGHLAYCREDNVALQMLKTAIEHHYCSYPVMDTDPFFSELRTRPGFEKLRQAGMACHNDFISNRDKPQGALSQTMFEQMSAALTLLPGS